MVDGPAGRSTPRAGGHQAPARDDRFGPQGRRTEIAELQGAPADVVPLDDLKGLRGTGKSFWDLPPVEQREFVALMVAEMKAYGKTKRVKITYRFRVEETGSRESTGQIERGSSKDGSS